MSKSNWHFWLTFFICVSLSLTLVQSASAAIAYVDLTSDISTTAREDPTFEHITPAGTDCYLIVGFFYVNAAANLPTSVTHDGNAMALLNSGYVSETWVRVYGLALGTLASPDTSDIAILIPATNVADYIVAMNYTGVHQTSAIGPTDNDSSSGLATVHNDITTEAANSIIVQFAVDNDDASSPYTQNSSQVERFDDNTGGGSSTDDLGCAGSDIAVVSAGANSLSVTSSSAGIDVVAMEVKQVSAGAVLALDPDTLNFTYAVPDSHAMKFGISNSGSGILSWETTNICTWLSSSCVDTGTVGAGYDSVTVEVLWAQVAENASLKDTVIVTGGGDGQVVINVTGEQVALYTVETNHPRLWVNENTLPTLEAKCNSAMSTQYGNVKTYVDANLLDDSYPLGDLEHYAVSMMQLGLCNFMEAPGDTAYYNEMKDMLAYIFAQASWSENLNYLHALALFYDWANDQLVTGGLDDNYGDSLAVALKYHTESQYSWYLMANAHPKLDELRPLAAGGVALYGDGHGTPLIDGDDTAIAACDTFYNNVFGAPHAIAMIDSIARDGGYFEGDYNRTYLSDFAHALWMFDSGTNVAAFDSTSCLAGWGDYIVWDTWCESSVAMGSVAFGFGKQGDSYRHSGSLGALRLLVNLLATAYQDPNAMWLEDQFGVHAPDLSSWAEYLYIVVHDTALSAISPVTASWPLAKKWDVGTVYMRNGWDLDETSEDVWAVYRHEQYPFGHAHADAGHFIIARGQDLLLLDSGLRACVAPTCLPHYNNYFTQTIAHNTITIKKTGESIRGVTENTGGQNYRVGSDGSHPVTVGDYTTRMAGDDERGNITDFSVVGDTLVYIRSDLTEAYADGKVDTVRREFVWMAPKNTFLIFDTVKTTGVNADTLEQKQLFHMIPNPATHSAIAYWTEGDSRAKLTSLHGTGDVTLTEVGGDSAHFLCNSTNYGSVHEGQEYDEGAYRLELKPGQSDSLRWMLTALQVTASADTSYSTLTLLTDGDYIGVAVDTDTLLFHKYGGAYVTSGGSAPAALALDPSTLNFTYAEPDSHSMKFGISNTGDGILSWTTTNICDWLSDSCVDTGTVGAGYDSVTVEVLWAQVAQDASLVDTVLVTGGGDGQVIINALGESTATPDTTTGVTGHRRTGSRRRGCGG